MRADVHMHTSFSHDSETAPEEMIKGAIEKNLKMICFTDHYDKDYLDMGDASIFPLEEYFQTLTKLQEKYKDQIDVRIGIELGLQPHLGSCFKQVTEQYPFDFVIGSVHVIKGEDPYFGTIFEGKTDEEVYRLTFQETLENIKNIKTFDVLGHLDYVVRYGRQGEEMYQYSRYADIIDEILKCLIEEGKGLEVNTAGLKYGLSFAHPMQKVLKRYRELGGEIITVGADGHKPEHIAYDFHLVNALLKDCGFAYYAEFLKRRPVFKQLS